MPRRRSPSKIEPFDISVRRGTSGPVGSTHAGFVSARHIAVYHPPAGKQLPTSCLGRFLRPVLSPSSLFLSSLSLFLSSLVLFLSPRRLAALRRPAARCHTGPRECGTKMVDRCILVLLRTRLRHASASSSFFPPPLNAARYFTAVCKSANAIDTRSACNDKFARR